MILFPLIHLEKCLRKATDFDDYQARQRCDPAPNLCRSLSVRVQVSSQTEVYATRHRGLVQLSAHCLP